MDYVIDSYFWNNNSEQLVINSGFIYDNERFCARLYVFSKIIGFIFYATSLLTCNNTNFFIGILIAMFLSIINSIRYEHAHFRRYRTIFSSINDFKIWKNKQYPKSRILFSCIEIIIKIVYFSLTFPPQINFSNLCEIGESIFKIHILVLFSIYIVGGVFSICFLVIINCADYSDSTINTQSNTISSPIQISINNNQNEECCICLDISAIDWSILPCGHKFHKECISIWLRKNRTCPICRLHFRSV